MSVYKKLQEARVRFHGKSLKKSGENKFAGYKYFELGDFLPTVQQIFHEVGLAGVISFGAEKASLVVVDVDKTDERIVFDSPSAEVVLKGCLPIQGIGAAQTYLRRYLWVAVMEIVENDVIDATTGKDDPKKKADVQKKVMPETEVASRIKMIENAPDAAAAKAAYQGAVKACNELGDTESPKRIKKALLEKWTPVSAAK